MKQNNAILEQIILNEYNLPHYKVVPKARLGCAEGCFAQYLLFCDVSIRRHFGVSLEHIDSSFFYLNGRQPMKIKDIQMNLYQ